MAMPRRRVPRKRAVAVSAAPVVSTFASTAWKG
jgi:hypothetical protein